jgi:flavin-dependent dehydrogenase
VLKQPYSVESPLVDAADVVVLGAGCAGCTAAIAAALAARSYLSAGDVPIAQLQARLRDDGALFGGRGA